LLKCAPIMTLVSYSFARDDPKRKSDSLFVSRVTIGLLCSAVGDACLVYEHEGFFIPGMIAFAIAHVLRPSSISLSLSLIGFVLSRQMFYVSAFGWRGPMKPWWLLLLTSPAVLVLRALMPALMEDEALKVAVPLYTGILVIMAWRAAAAASGPKATLSGEALQFWSMSSSLR